MCHGIWCRSSEKTSHCVTDLDGNYSKARHELSRHLKLHSAGGMGVLIQFSIALLAKDTVKRHFYRNVDA